MLPEASISYNSRQPIIRHSIASTYGILCFAPIFYVLSVRVLLALAHVQLATLVPVFYIDLILPKNKIKGSLKLSRNFKLIILVFF